MGSRALDQATGELESSCCIALRCSKCFPPRTHRLGWGLKAHPFEFTGDFLTTLRASEHEVKDSSVVRHKKIQGCIFAMERVHWGHLK